MGLTLVVYPAGRFDSLRKFPLNGEPLTLGAGPDSTVEIDAPNMRPKHAALSCRGGEWFLQGDEECSVGEVPLAEDNTRVVRIGDPIRVGDVLMELRQTSDESDESDPEEFLRPPPWPTVRVTEGPSVGHVLALKEVGRVYVIGRGPKADLTVEDRNVSREHLEVVRKKEGILVMDRTSTRGSWLGYTRLVPNRRARWDNRRMLKLGVTVLVVDEPAERLAEFSMRAPETAPVSVGRLSTTTLSYEDEGRDASASGVMMAPSAVPSSPLALGGMPLRQRSAPPPGPSALRTVLKVFGLLLLATAVAALIALVALLAR
jgi:hypothetical protein